MSESFEYINRRLESQRKWHSDQAGWNKKWFYTVEIITLVAGALIPIINVIDWPSGSHVVRILSASLAAILVVAASLGRLYKFQENWLNYRGLTEALRREEEMYLNRVGEYGVLSDQERNRLLVERVEGILASTTTQYLTLHRAERERPPTPAPPDSEKPTP